MFFRINSISYKINRYVDFVLLSLFCICGCVVGVAVSHSADPSFFSLMRMAAARPVSIVDLSLMILIPFLVTAAISFLGIPYLLFPVAFIKSLSYALLLSSITIAFGPAGWLVSCLMLLSDSICVVVLYWYFIRHVSGFRSTAVSDLFVTFLISLSVGLADSLFLSPYLAALIKS